MEANLTRWCLEMIDAVKPIVPIKTTGAFESRTNCSKIVVPNILFRAENSNKSFFQKADEERIGSNSPFGNIHEPLDIVKTTPFARYNNGICTILV